MILPAIPTGQYADAQIDDYGKLARSAFPWRAPLRMEVRARSSLPAATIATASDDLRVLRGTAGCGFWNYPFSVRGDILMLPEAIWFFYASPPSNMALVPDVPGWGWKAQVIHAMRPQALLAALPLLLTTGWGRLTHHTTPAAHWLQRVSGASEYLLPTTMTTWHTYTLEWQPGVAHIRVDDTPVLILRFGAASTGPQWFELDSVHIQPL